MKNYLCLAGLAVAALVSGDATARLPGGISGPWYNPQQSGHGLSVNVLRDGGAVVVWHVFDPTGAPLTLYIDGRVDGRRIEGVAYAPKGMAFGEFDPRRLQLPRWGEVDLEFNDCANARLTWQAADPAYGSGAMSIKRLAFLGDVGCELPPANPLPAGLYEGRAAATASRPALLAQGIVDKEGRLWGVERALASGEALEVPGSSGVSIPTYFRMEPLVVEPGRIQTQSVAGPVVWSSPLEFGEAGTFAGYAPTTGEWQLGPSIVGSLRTRDPSGERLYRWTPGAAANTRLVAPIGLADLVGRYRFPLRTEVFYVHFAEVNINAAGQICLKMNPNSAPERCDFSGSAATPDGDIGVIEFELRGRISNARPITTFRGRGWKSEVGNRSELVLVGDDGERAFALIAQP